MQQQNIKKLSKAVRKIVQEFFTGGLTAKPLEIQSPTPDKSGVALEGKPRLPHVGSGIVNPMITREVQRFMRGQQSPVIEGLLSIDEIDLRNARIACGERGILMMIPATTHDTGAGVEYAQEKAET